MALLSVNVNKVATLRNTRALSYPSPVDIAERALRAGAAGITIHPRPDARHIRPGDVAEIAALVARWPGKEFNIEGNPFHGLLPLLQSLPPEHRPHQLTLVPDAEGQSTSDHGFDLLRGDTAALRDIILALRPYLRSPRGRISLFMDPNPAQVSRVPLLGVQVERVELYTEPYAADPATLSDYRTTAATALELGLGINAGHDLTLTNLPPLIAAIPEIAEVSIGHALIADALLFGIDDTVHRYIAAAAAAAR